MRFSKPELNSPLNPKEGAKSASQEGRMHPERLTRRRFITKAAAGVGSLAAFTSGCSSVKFASVHGQVMTVHGPIDPGEMGTTLPHEHVLVDFIGAAKISRDRYNPDGV